MKSTFAIGIVFTSLPSFSSLISNIVRLLVVSTDMPPFGFTSGVVSFLQCHRVGQVLNHLAFSLLSGSLATILVNIIVYAIVTAMSCRHWRAPSGCHYCLRPTLSPPHLFSSAEKLGGESLKEDSYPPFFCFDHSWSHFQDHAWFSDIGHFISWTVTLT